MQSRTDSKYFYRQQGFTIVEVLVAMALFAIVVLVVLVPITRLFGLTKRSNTQVGATSQAQQWIEQVRGQWQNQSTYNRACINVATGLPSYVKIKIQDEDLRGTPVGSAYDVLVSTNCAALTASVSPAPLRLVEVTATINNLPSVLTVEVAQ